MLENIIRIFLEKNSGKEKLLSQIVIVTTKQLQSLTTWYSNSEREKDQWKNYSSDVFVRTLCVLKK